MRVFSVGFKLKPHERKKRVEEMLSLGSAIGNGRNK